MEAKTQSKLIQYLKTKGFYVIKTRPGPGVPIGCPDVLAFKEGFWCAFEVKASKTSKFRPRQKETVEKFNDWSYARVVYESNLAEIKKEVDLFA